MIEDNELREIFKAESLEHLQRLEEGLLNLETNPLDRDNVEELFREAHSLKGASRMLGLTKIEIMAHAFEDLLSASRNTAIPLTREKIATMYQSLDGLKELVEEALTGKAAQMSIVKAMDRFKEIEPARTARKLEDKTEDKKDEHDPDSEPDQPSSHLPGQLPDRMADQAPDRVSIQSPGQSIGQAPDPLPAQATDETPQRTKAGHEETSPSRPPAHTPLKEDHPSPSHPSHPGGASASGRITGHASESSPPSKPKEEQSPIDTVRVDAKKLDTLLTHAGELSVVKNRILQRLADIEEFMDHYSQASRDLVSLARTAYRHGAQEQRTVDAVELSECLEKHNQRLDTLLVKLRDDAAEDTARLSLVCRELEEGIYNLRLMPLSLILHPFKRMVRDLAAQEAKEIILTIEGGETTADKRILEEMKAPLTHMVRNAIDHGIETVEERTALGKPPAGTIVIRAGHRSNTVVLEIEDDGRGLSTDKIKEMARRRNIASEAELEEMSTEDLHCLVFTSGFSTSDIITDISGRGIGMDVVMNAVKRLKGTIHLESTAMKGCTVSIELPVTLSTTRVFLVKAQETTYALPMEHVQTARLVQNKEIFTIQGMKTITMDGRSISAAHLSDLLDLPSHDSFTASKGANAGDSGNGKGERLPCIVLAIGKEEAALFVDSLVDELETVVKGNGDMLRGIRNVSGSTILGNGEVCLVLNSEDLLLGIKKKSTPRVPSLAVEEEKVTRTILLAEDSITTRTQMKRILEDAGYQVITAVDGSDAYNKLSSHIVNAVVSDIQMPNMDGLGLTAKIRKDNKYRELPIILVTTLSSEEDMKRGIEAGADAYIAKPAFDRDVFIETLRRLV